jgi:type VI secretion system Hcp family effector
MPFEAYILVDGFEGDSVKNGHPKKSSIVFAIDHGIRKPTDLAHGTISGRREHGAMKVSMVIDSSSYQYYDNLIKTDQSGAKKLNIEIGMFRPDQTNVGIIGNGEAATYYTIQMKDAMVTAIRHVMGDSRGSQAQGAGQPVRTEYLEVEFVYREIHWTFKKGNKETMDKWDA